MSYPTMSYPTSYQFTREFANSADSSDSLSMFRNEFDFPQHNGGNAIYMTGNSLGLMPKNIPDIIADELTAWKTLGVEGHTKAPTPWFSYHTSLTESLAKLCGALPIEVVAMNALTVNVHLMMTSFYRPEGKRFKIMVLGQEFPSDRYAAQSQVMHHGFSPEDAIIELHPRNGEYLLRHEDILSAINQAGDELALVHFSAVHYYTGQYFDIESITQKAHDVGAKVGWDLAHTIGNIPIQLHDWNVDYAVWCTYKYLNSSPGGVGGAFVHERHCTSPDTLRLAGWWGNDPSKRFTMPHAFVPYPTAESWQLSNEPILLMAVHRAALKQFDNAGLQNLRAKSIALTGYLEYVINEVNRLNPVLGLEIITPRNPQERGAQLSLVAKSNGRVLFDYLTANGVIADWRNPDVIRCAPAPMYCSFEDVYQFGDILLNYKA